MRCAIFILAMTFSAAVYSQSIFDDEWEPPKRRSEQPEKAVPPAKDVPRKEEPAKVEPEPMDEHPGAAEEPKPVPDTDDGRIRQDGFPSDEPRTEEKPSEPAEEPPADPGNLSPAEKKLLSGLSQLKGRDAREALATFQSLLNELPRSTSPKLDDPVRINAMHGLAVAYLQVNDLHKARQQMDRIYASLKTNRSIVLNHAVIDMQSRDAVRAAMSLARHLETAKSDERAINLLGLAIKRAVKDKRSAGVKKYVEDYLRFDAQLEATQPGRKRWGSSWISPKEHAEITKRRNEQIEKCNRIASRLDDAEDDLERAKKEYRARRLNRQGSLDYYERRVADAERNVDAIADELTRERRKIENPKWAEDFTPELPELALKDK